MSEVTHRSYRQSLGEEFIERGVKGEGREETSLPLQKNSGTRVRMGRACFLKGPLHLCTDYCLSAFLLGDRPA